MPHDSEETELGNSSETLLTQQVKVHGQFSCNVVDGSVSLQLFLVVWIFLRSLSVIFYDR